MGSLWSFSSYFKQFSFLLLVLFGSPFFFICSSLDCLLIQPSYYYFGTWMILSLFLPNTRHFRYQLGKFSLWNLSFFESVYKFQHVVWGYESINSSSSSSSFRMLQKSQIIFFFQLWIQQFSLLTSQIRMRKCLLSLITFSISFYHQPTLTSLLVSSTFLITKQDGNSEFPSRFDGIVNLVNLGLKPNFY